MFISAIQDEEKLAATLSPLFFNNQIFLSDSALLIGRVVERKKSLGILLKKLLAIESKSDHFDPIYQHVGEPFLRIYIESNPLLSQICSVLFDL